jgi:hypothetical protein
MPGIRDRHPTLVIHSAPCLKQNKDVDVVYPQQFTTLKGGASLTNTTVYLKLAK